MKKDVLTCDGCGELIKGRDKIWDIYGDKFCEACINGHSKPLEIEVYKYENY
jgi:hypothetical protein